MAAVDIVGREVELASVHAFLERSAEGPVALVLEGEAGIGKSTSGGQASRLRVSGDFAFSSRGRPKRSEG